jgi:Sugar (and other) transporter
MALAILAPMLSFPGPDGSSIVSSPSPGMKSKKLTAAYSFLPESPRYLISKDRREEAFDILVYYHAEGDRDSIFVKAEMVQIETTIQIELEASKLTWMDMIRTP